MNYYEDECKMKKRRYRATKTNKLVNKGKRVEKTEMKVSDFGNVVFSTRTSRI